MKPSEVVFDDKVSNRDKFGTFVRDRRTELGISLRSLAESLDITPAYLSDIERGNRKAPFGKIEQMAEILAIEDSELEFFADLAGGTHSNWSEINEYLSKNKGARDFIRQARDMGLSGEEFLAVVNQMIEESQGEKIQGEPLDEMGK